MVDRLPDEGLIDPLQIRFSQNSIRGTFRTGGNISDLAMALMTGRVEPRDVPPLRIFERHGRLYTLDNRRLWALRHAPVPIPYRKATKQEVEQEIWKFKPVDDGSTVRIRGEFQ